MHQSLPFFIGFLAFFVFSRLTFEYARRGAQIHPIMPSSDSLSKVPSISSSGLKPLEKFLQGGEPMFLLSGEGLVLWANTQAQELFGPQAKVVGKSLSELFGAQAAKLTSFVHYSIANLGYRRTDGTLSEFAAIIIDSGAGDPHDQVFFMALKPVRSAIDSGAEVREFLGTLSHDLKNPLAAIFGYADTLVDTDAGSGLTPAQRSVIKTIRRIASRAIGFVRNCEFLTYAPSHFERVITYSCDLNTIVVGVLDHVVREEASCPSIKVLLDPAPVMIPLHQVQAERIVSNLIDNALKYTPASETVSIKTFSAGARAGISVHNSGVYIPPEEQQKIFERHHRGSTSEGTSGSGLGLYIVKRIIDAAGAELKLESNAASGTEFSIWFKKA